MQLIVLYTALMSLGVQALIIVRHQYFGRDLFGSDIDTVVFIGLAVVEMLVVVLWITWAKFSIAELVRDESAEEGKAETGQTSRLPAVRGESLEKLVNAYEDRVLIQIEAFRRFGWPLLVAVLVFAGIAIVMAGVALGNM